MSRRQGSGCIGRNVFKGRGMDKQRKSNIIMIVYFVVLFGGLLFTAIYFPEYLENYSTRSIRPGRILTAEEVAEAAERAEIHRLRISRPGGRPLTGEELARRMMMTAEELREEERLRVAEVERIKAGEKEREKKQAPGGAPVEVDVEVAVESVE